MDHEAVSTKTPSQMSKESLEQLVIYVKIATAMAVLKNKPKHLSGFQYAKELCANYQQKQLQLRDRVKYLESQTEQLKVLLLQSECNSSSSTQLTGEIVLNQNSSKSLPALPDSLAIPINLRSSAECLVAINQLKSLLNPSKNISQSYVKNTVSSSMKVLRTWLVNEDCLALLKEEQWTEGAEVILALLNEGSQFVMQTTEGEMQTFTEHALSAIVNDKLGKQVLQDQRSRMLLSICSNENVLAIVLDQLLECIRNFTNYLQSMNLDFRMFSSSMVENLYIIFALLENLLNSPQMSQLVLNSKVDLEYLLSSLQNSAQNIPTYYVLYASYMYHLIAIIEKKSQCLTNQN